jgi:HEPN domain-containing protein
VPGWIIGFHLQQAAEKMLKALLVLAGEEPPRTHDLVSLHRLLSAAGGTDPIPDDTLKALQPFAVEERYPLLVTSPAGRDEVAPFLVPLARAVAAVGRMVGLDE